VQDNFLNRRKKDDALISRFKIFWYRSLATERPTAAVVVRFRELAERDNLLHYPAPNENAENLGATSLETFHLSKFPLQKEYSIQRRVNPETTVHHFV
jgi:hypothetical protein